MGKELDVKNFTTEQIRAIVVDAYSDGMRIDRIIEAGNKFDAWLRATIIEADERYPFPSGTVVEVTYHAPRSAPEPQTYVKHAGSWWKGGFQLVYTDRDIDGFIRRGTGVLIHKPEGN